MSKQLSQHLYSQEPVLVTALIAAGRAQDLAGVDEATLELHKARPDLVRDPSDTSRLDVLRAQCARIKG